MSAVKTAAPTPFDVDLQPSADGGSFATFRRNSAAICTVSLAQGAKASDFRFHSTAYQLPHATLARVSCSAHVMHRGAREIAAGRRQIMLFALIRGEVTSEIENGRRFIAAGDVSLFDYARGYHSTVTDFEMVAVFAERDRVPPVFRLPEAHGAILPAAGGAARLLRQQLAALHDAAGALSLGEATSAINGVFETAAVALTEALARERAAAFGPDAALVEKALAIIDANLAARDLTPQRLGKELGLSRSSLYRLFEPLGGVGAVVLQRRLDRAVGVILGETSRQPNWRKIAANHGFASEAHFARAYRARFRVTPRTFHDMVRRGDNESLLTLAWRGGFASTKAWLESTAGDAANR
jgi:AraC-like DNA-binding protein